MRMYKNFFIEEYQYIFNFKIKIISIFKLDLKEKNLKFINIINRNNII